MAAGVFQVAHAGTDNRIESLAISASGNIIAGLSRWKDIVLFNVPERRLDLVRQIRDEVGWYDQGPGLIMLANDARAIVTVGTGQPATPRRTSHPCCPSMGSVSSISLRMPDSNEVSMSRSTALTLIALLLCGGMLLAACGGGEPPAGPTQPHRLP
jgi:hypothetical protein